MRRIQYGPMIKQRFDTPHYVPLAEHDFTHINVTIRNDINRPIKFYNDLIQ